MNASHSTIGVLCGLVLTASAHGNLVNPDFAAGLADWTDGGTVLDGGGFALFGEDPVLASSSLYQDFDYVFDGPGGTLPAAGGTLSFEYTLDWLGTFDPSGGALPDAFTARLLDAGTLAPLVGTTHYF